MLLLSASNKIFGVCLIALSLMAVALCFRKPLAGVVGETSIYQQEVEFRNQIVQIYFPHENRKLGFFQLYKSAINLEILRNNGIEFSREQVLDEEIRISKNSFAPEKLSAIRNIFGDDFESYLKVFVLPNLADRYIYSEFFASNLQVQAESLARVQELILQLRSTDGEGMAKLAKNIGYKFDLLSLSSNGGLRWRSQSEWDTESQKYAPAIKDSEPPKLDAGAEATRWYEKVLAHLTAGQVYPEPISYGDFWLVIRADPKPVGKINKLEVIFVPKINYQAWYEQEKLKLTIQTYQPVLNEEMKP